MSEVFKPISIQKHSSILRLTKTEVINLKYFKWAEIYRLGTEEVPSMILVVLKNKSFRIKLRDLTVEASQILLGE